MLIGSYQPPLRRLGASIDRLVLHTVATTTIHGFLTEISASLQPAAHSERAPAPEWNAMNPTTA